MEGAITPDSTSAVPSPRSTVKEGQYVSDAELIALGQLAVAEVISMQAENDVRLAANMAPAYSECWCPSAQRLREILVERRVIAK